MQQEEKTSKWKSESTNHLTISQMAKKLVEQIGEKKATIFTVQFQNLNLQSIASNDLQRAADILAKAERLMYASLFICDILMAILGTN